MAEREIDREWDREREGERGAHRDRETYRKTEREKDGEGIRSLALVQLAGKDSIYAQNGELIPLNLAWNIPSRGWEQSQSVRFPKFSKTELWQL